MRQRNTPFNEIIEQIQESQSFSLIRNNTPTPQTEIEKTYYKLYSKRESVESIITTLSKLLPSSGKLIAYGSSYYDFYDGKSSVDLTFLTTEKPTLFCYNVEDHVSALITYFAVGKNEVTALLFQIFKILEKAATATNITSLIAIDRALVPVVSARLGTVDVEITINNHEGVYNSEIFKTYFGMHVKVRSFLSHIKRYHKEAKFINTKATLFKTFTINIMALAFLITIDMLPELQDDNLIDNPTKHCKHHIIHSHPALCDKQEVRWVECSNCFLKYQRRWDAVSLDELFVEFLNYYIHFDFSQKICINPTYHKHYPFTSASDMFVVAPFLPFLNLTKKISSELSHLLTYYRSSFQRIIQSPSNSTFAINYSGNITTLLKCLDEYSAKIVVCYYAASSIGGVAFVSFSTKQNVIQFKKSVLCGAIRYINHCTPFDSKILNFEPDWTKAIKYTKK
ncbi:Poly(A) RNA polymerase mitochondrial-like central palm domain-containing protein [Entamoeba marina]